MPQMPATKGDLEREFVNAIRTGTPIQVTFHDAPKADRRPSPGVQVLLRWHDLGKIKLTPEDDDRLEAIYQNWEMPDSVKVTFTMDSRLKHPEIGWMAIELSKSFRHVQPAPALEAPVPS